MSPKAIQRRQCIRAMRRLIREFGYTEEDFEIVARGETGIEGSIPGTPIYWTPPSYFGESDCFLASHELTNVAVGKDDGKYWAREARQMYVQERDKAMREHPERFWLSEGATK